MPVLKYTTVPILYKAITFIWTFSGAVTLQEVGLAGSLGVDGGIEVARETLPQQVCFDGSVVALV